MIKKVVYVGLAIIAISLAGGFLEGNQISGSYNSQMMGALITISNIQNASIPAGGFADFRLNSSGITGSSLFSISGSMYAGSVNVYLFNSSGFAAWSSDSPAATGNGLEDAVSLEGRGALLIFENVTREFTYSITNSTKGAGTAQQNQANYTGVAYRYAGLNLSREGSYYFVLDNTNSSGARRAAAKALVAFIGPTTESALAQNPAVISLGNMLSSSQSALNNVYVAFGAIFIIGLIIAITGLVYTPRQAAEAASGATEEQERYIDELYKNVGKKAKGRKRRNARKSG
jgi:hypothetical protein